MGCDCTIWSLDPQNGERTSLGLDRSYVFEFVEAPAKNHFCERFINRRDAICWLDYLTRNAYSNERKDYHSHWLGEARNFINTIEQRNSQDFWFTVVSEHFDVESRRKDFADALVRAQWPLCPMCEFPAGRLKKADRWSEHSVGLFTAECSHMGKGEKLIFEAPPVNLENWVLKSALPAYGEKFDQP